MALGLPLADWELAADGWNLEEGHSLVEKFFLCCMYSSWQEWPKLSIWYFVSAGGNKRGLQLVEKTNGSVSI